MLEQRAGVGLAGHLSREAAKRLARLERRSSKPIDESSAARRDDRRVDLAVVVSLRRRDASTPSSLVAIERVEQRLGGKDTRAARSLRASRSAQWRKSASAPATARRSAV